MDPVHVLAPQNVYSAALDSLCVVILNYSLIAFNHPLTHPPYLSYSHTLAIKEASRLPSLTSSSFLATDLYCSFIEQPFDLLFFASIKKPFVLSLFAFIILTSILTQANLKQTSTNLTFLVCF